MLGTPLTSARGAACPGAPALPAHPAHAGTAPPSAKSAAVRANERLVGAQPSAVNALAAGGTPHPSTTSPQPHVPAATHSREGTQRRSDRPDEERRATIGSDDHAPELGVEVEHPQQAQRAAAMKVYDIASSLHGCRWARDDAVSSELMKESLGMHRHMHSFKPPAHRTACTRDSPRLTTTRLKCTMAAAPKNSRQRA